VARWCNGKAFGLAISRSRVQILLEATLRNNLRQVVYTYVLVSDIAIFVLKRDVKLQLTNYTYVPLSPSSITWYWPKGGDALWLGR